MTSRSRSRFAAVGRPLLTSALIVGLFYVVPVDLRAAQTQVVLRAAATLAGGLVVTWLIYRQVARQVDDPQGAPLSGLLTALVGGVTFFAFVDYVTAVSTSNEFVGLNTRTDALYFAMSTLITVGFGDVHAAGQFARGIVIVQMMFNVVVIATAASVLSRQIGSRARERRAAKPPPAAKPPR